MAVATPIADRNESNNRNCNYHNRERGEHLVPGWDHQKGDDGHKRGLDSPDR
jgi:hypothetical protein